MTGSSDALVAGGIRAPNARYDAVLFDLLTALIDSWSLWNDVAGSEDDGRRWRREYLGLTYAAGEYRPYLSIVAEAAEAAGLSSEKARQLAARWSELTPWPDVAGVLAAASHVAKLGVVTNCSIELGNAAATRTYAAFDTVITAEAVGFYKPCREPYLAALESLGTAPERALFVAGSASDVPGATAVGMPVYWHNRIGLPAADAVKPKYHRRTLSEVPGLLRA